MLMHNDSAASGIYIPVYILQKPHDIFFPSLEPTTFTYVPELTGRYRPGIYSGGIAEAGRVK